LGRLIVEGAKEVRILGQYYPVRAKVVYMNGFSGHADRDQLLHWLASLQRPPRRLFVTHGEPSASRYFASLVRERPGWEVAIPEYQDRVLLD
ncbi:MAG: MBL fold metallo-hydrolase RNA specificity domain-containing protein, partial [Chloroflexota bacterium]|nr:MBL fold metallo-hydrolase RNA specificity domain-containing protein [Chloroflexota bacterium]